jgi:hypothetical protein
LALLGFLNRFSCEFRDPYTLKTIYVSLLRPKLEYANCVRRRVQKNFVRYALRGLGWTNLFELRSYVDRSALFCLGTLVDRRANACVMFIFDILSGRVNSSNFLSLISINAPSDFLRVDFHRTNYSVHEPLNGAVRSFNESAGLFDLHLSRNQFFNRLRSVL